MKLVQMRNIFLTVISLCCFLPYTIANNYYFSTSAHNSGNKGTKEDPFTSISAFESLTLEPGDSVLFKSGDIFHGTIVLKQSGAAKNPITLSSFGKGPMPVITGAGKIDDLHSNSRNNLHTFMLTDTVVLGIIYRNKIKPAARYPEDEWLTFDGGGRDFMIDSSLSDKFGDLKGATIRMRIKNWSYQYKTIDRISHDTLFFNDVLWYNNYVSYTADPGWGYYLENMPQFVDKEGEWAFRKSKNLLYLYSADHTFQEFSLIRYNNGIQVSSEVANIAIEGLEIKNFYESGIIVGEETSDISILNCKIENNVLYGIKSNEGAKNLIISNCNVSNILGQGISLLECNNSVIKGNVVKRIGLIPAYGINGNNGGMGIIITNNEIRPAGYTRIAHHNLISNNLVDSIGSYPIRMDGTYSICEKNVVSNGLLTLNDGSLIYCWAMDSTFTHHNIIRDNIAMYTHGNLEGTPNDHHINAGIYIDNDVHHIQVENNFISGTQIGILFNCGTHSNSAKNNIIYDNEIGLSFSEYQYAGSIYNDTIINNTIIGEDYGQKSIVLKSYVGDMVQPGIIDNNYHYNTKEQFLFQVISTHENFRRTDEMDITRWKSLGMGTKSTSLLLNEGFSDPEIIVNKSLKEKTIQLGNTARTIAGEVTNSITIPPVSGVVIFQKP